MKAAACVLAVALPALGGCASFHKGAMPGEPANARFADVDGVRVRFTDSGEPGATPAAAPASAQSAEGAVEEKAAPAGEKPTVVFVHGFASALEAWSTVVPAVAPGRRVITLDLKGFGWTDRPEGDYSPDAEAKLVLRLLEQRGVHKATWVAHSWGSSVALAAALQAPERVTRIALYDAWVYEDQLPTFFHWSRSGGVGDALFGLFYSQRADERISLAFYDKKFVTEKFVEDVEAALDRPGTTAAALAAVRGMNYENAETRYRKIDKPVLLMWGREDIVTPLKFGERLSRDLPKSRLVVYPRCGHFPMIEAMSASNRDLVAFLASTEEKP
ncbi:MAG: alpha/beta fold hydrolase [Deltaproteobacteria bacterium]|nr:alpha/beta fold hydrolase [Deltaproteobacteria bacterium]